MTHLKFTLLGNRCLTQDDTIRGKSGRRNQHHPVSFSWRFAGYYFAPALAGLWKKFSITIAVPGVVIQNDSFHVHGLGNSEIPPGRQQIINSMAKPACFPNWPPQKLAIERPPGKPYQDTPYCEASGTEFVDSFQFLASCFTFLRRCAEYPGGRGFSKISAIIDSK